MTRIFVSEVIEKDINESIHLSGWVQRRRDLGGLIFIDLRDRSGIIQIVFNPEISEEALKIAEDIRSEYVIDVKGTISQRDESQVNPNIDTGKIEIIVEEVNVISKAKTPPFHIQDDTVTEDVRLKYRYLDLRRPKLQNTLKLRHQLKQSVHSFLGHEGLIDVETPVLSKSTPEGARDYLVP